MRIMLIDGSDFERIHLDRLLSKNGHNVVSLRSSDEALTRLSAASSNHADAHSIDCVVVMGDIAHYWSGIDLVERLRKHFAILPTIYVASLPQHFLKWSLLAAGASVCLSRPFNIKDLEESIARVGAAALEAV